MPSFRQVEPDSPARAGEDVGRTPAAVAAAAGSGKPDVSAPVVADERETRAARDEEGAGRQANGDAAAAGPTGGPGVAAVARADGEGRGAGRESGAAAAARGPERGPPRPSAEVVELIDTDEEEGDPGPRPLSEGARDGGARADASAMMRGDTAVVQTSATPRPTEEVSGKALQIYFSTTELMNREIPCNHVLPSAPPGRPAAR